MKVKKYRATDRTTALKQIRAELGPEAVIVHEQAVRRGFLGKLGVFGRPEIEILAAVEEGLDAPAARQSGADSRQGGVEATVSAAARALAADLAPAGESNRGRAAAGQAAPAAGGLSDEGASRLARILETFPRNGQPVPPAMAASLAGLIVRAAEGAKDEPVAGQRPAEAAPEASPPAGRQGSPDPAAPVVEAPVVAAAPEIQLPRAAAAPANGSQHPAPAAGKRTDAANGAGAGTPNAPNAGSASAGSASAGGVEQALLELQTMVHRLAQQQQDSQLPREAPAVRIAYQRLIAQEVDPGLALDLIGTLSDEVGNDTYVTQEHVDRRLAEMLEARLPARSLPAAGAGGGPAVVILIGPTGVGKTTTLAKLASHLAFNEDRRVGLVTTDTFRIAAAAQLGTYADILELPLEVVYTAQEMGRALATQAGADVILVDTPGCGQQDEAQLRELRKFVLAAREAVPTATVLLTVAATTKLRDMLQIRQGFGLVPLDGLVLTKLDETNAFGPLVSLVARLSTPVYYLTTGQKVPSDIEPAAPSRLARLVLHGLERPALIRDEALV